MLTSEFRNHRRGYSCLDDWATTSPQPASARRAAPWTKNRTPNAAFPAGQRRGEPCIPSLLFEHERRPSLTCRCAKYLGVADARSRRRRSRFVQACLASASRRTIASIVRATRTAQPQWRRRTGRRNQRQRFYLVGSGVLISAHKLSWRLMCRFWHMRSGVC